MGGVIMSTQGGQVFVFGYSAFEIEADYHIKTRVIFGVANAKFTRLAWYMFSQDLVVPQWQRVFEQSKTFHTFPSSDLLIGEALPNPPFTSQTLTLDFDKLADPAARPVQLSTGFLPRSPATLDIKDRGNHLSTYRISLPSVAESLTFDLIRNVLGLARRHTLNI